MISHQQSEDKTTQEFNLIEKLKDCPDWDREEQLKKNQAALRLLKRLIHEHKNMSDKEAQQRLEFWEEFKEIIDAQRPTGAKLLFRRMIVFVDSGVIGLLTNLNKRGKVRQCED